MAFLEGWVISFHANEIIMIILILQNGKLKKRYDEMLWLEDAHVYAKLSFTVLLFPLIFIHQQFAEGRRCVHVFGWNPFLKQVWTAGPHICPHRKGSIMSYNICCFIVNKNQPLKPLNIEAMLVLLAFKHSYFSDEIKMERMNDTLLDLRNWGVWPNRTRTFPQFLSIFL